MFEEMQQHGCRPDVVTYTALISAFQRGGLWQRALKVSIIMFTIKAMHMVRKIVHYFDCVLVIACSLQTCPSPDHVLAVGCAVHAGF